MNKLANRFVLLCTIVFIFVLKTGAQVTISGTVKQSNGTGISGASINIKGGNKGTVTGSMGEYKISVNQQPSVTIEVSSVGFEKLVKSFDLRSSEVNADFVLKETENSLGTLVVTATNAKRTQFETPMSITSLNSKDIENRKFNSTADIFRGIPGIVTENSGGAVASNVYVRGLPTGGQYILTPIHIDGMPVLGTTGLNSSATDVYYRNDMGIGKIETVLGGVSNLYGSGSVVGLINILSKTGNDIPTTTIQTEYSTPGRVQLDLHTSGSLSKNMYYSLATTYRYDNGPIKTGLISQGYQIRGNVKKNFDNGDQLTFYFQHINDKVQYYLPYPIDSTFTRPKGWDGEDIYSLITKDVEELSVKTPDGVYKSKGANGILTNGGYFMTDFKHSFENDLKIDFKVKAAKYYHEFNFFNLSGSGANPAPQQNFATSRFGTNISNITYSYASDGTILNPKALVLVNNITDRIRPVDDLAAQATVSKNLEIGKTSHSITSGIYLSNTNAGDFNFQINYLSEFNNSARIINLAYTDAAGIRKSFTNNGVVSAPQYINRNSSSFKKALFLTDEIKLNDKFRVDLGLRYEGQDAVINSEKRASAITNSDGISVNWGSGNFDRFNLSANDLAISVASNYAISKSLAIYGNFSKGYYFPELRSFNVVYVNNLPQYPKLETEKIKQAEIGAKFYKEKITASMAFYYEELNNRRSVAYVLTAGVVNQNTFITSAKALGIESAIMYKISKNFTASGSLTYTNSEYTDFQQNKNLIGNRIPRRPLLMNDLSLEYRVKSFSVRMNNFYNGTRFADDANATEFPPYNLTRADVSYTIKGKKNETIVLNAGIFNLFDNAGITEGSFTSGTTQLNNQKYFIGRPVLPRSFYIRTTFTF